MSLRTFPFRSLGTSKPFRPVFDGVIVPLPNGLYGAVILSPFILYLLRCGQCTLALRPLASTCPGAWTAARPMFRAQLLHDADLFSVKQGRHVTTIGNFQQARVGIASQRDGRRSPSQIRIRSPKD